MKSTVWRTLSTSMLGMSLLCFSGAAQAGPPELSITDIFPNAAPTEAGFQSLISGFYVDPENDIVSITAQVEGVGDEVGCIFDTTSSFNAFRCILPFPGAGEFDVTATAVDATGASGSASTTIPFTLPDAPLLSITDVFPAVVVEGQLTALISGSFLTRNDIASFSVQVDGVTQPRPCAFDVAVGLFRCFPVFPGPGQYLVTANALDVEGSIGSASITFDVDVPCTDNRATLREHRAAGRAVRRFVLFASRFFAVGSGDFLGSDSGAVVDVRETGPGFFEAGVCP